MDTFEFGAPPSGVLKVREDHHLSDAHHLLINNGDEYVATTSTCFLNRVPVAFNFGLVFTVGRQ
jgi:hypothetical protein